MNPSGNVQFVYVVGDILPEEIDDSTIYIVGTEKKSIYVGSELIASDLTADFETLRTYIETYLGSEDFIDDISTALQAMVTSGAFSELLAPMVAEELPGVVASQIDQSVASQISVPAAAAASDWLEEHIDPQSQTVIDDSLTIRGAAADAKAAGDGISQLKSALTQVDTILNISPYYPKSDTVTTSSGNATNFPELTGLSFKGGKSYTITYSINRQASSKAYFYVKDSEGHNLFTGRQIAVGDTEGTWSHEFTENDLTGCFAQILCTDYPITGSLTISETIVEKNSIEKLDDAVDALDNRVNALESSEPLKKLNNRFNAIAYSKVIAEGNDGNTNTKENFIWCANRPEFATIKADMRLTSDGKVILCHDAGVTLNQSGDIISYDSENMTPIHDLTYDQCLALKFASTGYHMCGLETVIKICKMYGKLLFITIRNEYVDETLSVLFNLLDKHNFRDYTIINNFVANLTTLGKVREIDPNIFVSYTSANVNFITTELVDIVEDIGNAIFCGTGFGSNTQSVDDVLSGKETAIAYATSKGIPVYAATVYDGSFIDGLLDYGLSGCQIGVVPEFD